MELKDKIAIITGAARGIGFAIAKKFVEEGATVVIVDVNEETLKASAGELGENAYGHVCDISDVDQIQELVKWTMDKFGRIDILVNNAGISTGVTIEDITVEDWDKMLNINLRGTAFLSKYVFIEMKKAGYGRIVNMGSMAGERGGRYAGINYSASKAGVIVLTKCFGLSGAEYGITCNALAPGLIETAMSKALNHNPNDVPMKKLGQPEDVANAAVFLASDRASYISGMTIDVNGGMFMRP